MDTPGSMEVPPPGPLLARGRHALAILPVSTKLAMLCLVSGWFFTKTLVVSLGSIEHGVRFFDLAAVIADPMRLFFGIETTLQRIVFGLVCLGCVLAPLAPRLTTERSAWLWYVAPLALIVACGTALYWRTSSEFVVNRHLSVGGGAYLALIGGLVLLFQGLDGYRRADALR